MSADLQTIQALDLRRLPRTPGTAAFVYALGEIDMSAFVRQVTAQRTLPERVLLVRIVTVPGAHVAPESQAAASSLGHGIHLVTVRFGADDAPDVPLAFSRSAIPVLDASSTITWNVDGERIGHEELRTLATWQRWVFSLMARRGESAARRYRIPSARSARQKPNFG